MPESAAFLRAQDAAAAASQEAPSRRNSVSLGAASAEARADKKGSDGHARARVGDVDVATFEPPPQVDFSMTALTAAAARECSGRPKAADLEGSMMRAAWVRERDERERERERDRGEVVSIFVSVEVALFSFATVVIVLVGDDDNERKKTSFPSTLSRSQPPSLSKPLTMRGQTDAVRPRAPVSSATITYVRDGRPTSARRTSAAAWRPAALAGESPG